MDDPSQPDYLSRIESACRYLEDHLDTDPPLEEVAQSAHFSPFHFHRLFRGLTGETVRGYSRRLRLERAAHHLIHGENDILAIALDAGYASHEAFTRAFTKHLGVTPSGFREQRQGLKPPAASAQAKPIEARIERMDASTIACARHVGPYSEVGGAWKTLMKWGWSKMVFGKARTFGMCFDDPDVTEPARIRYDACMIVPEKSKVKKSNIQLRELPAATYAVTLHEGPYALLGEAYADLFAHIALNKVDGRRWTLGDPPSIEQYLNDPRKTKPEDLRTEIWMPVH